MSAPVSRSVKKCLLPSLVALLAAAVAACSQTSEPEGVEGGATPVAEKLRPEKKPRPDTGKKTPEKRVKPPVEKVLPPAPEELPAPSPAPAAEELSSATRVPQESAAAFPPAALPQPFVPSAPGKRIAQLSVPGPYVAVTFDDGPSSALTPQVLDIFARHGARATFFVLGRNANRNRSILARAVAEGHEVGSHTWSHINMRAGSTDTVIRELDRTATVIEEATGSRPKVMRPPYGAANKAVIDLVYKRYGTPAILWDVDTNDWRKPGTQTIVNRAVGKARPGSIILLHDIHASTLAAVEDIVTGLQARGFKLVTVSELIDMARRAAGAASPAAPAPAEQPEEGVLPAPAPEPQPEVLPQGAAAIGTAPAAPTAPADDDFHFYEEI